MEVVFRKAEVRDAEALKELNEKFNGPGGQTVEGIARCLSEEGQELIWVAEKDNKLVGFCCCQMKKSFCYEDVSAELTELYVEPAARRTGVARGLIREVMLHCEKMGAHTLTLLTGEDNLPARRFYESMGFAPSGEVHYEKDMKAP